MNDDHLYSIMNVYNNMLESLKKDNERDAKSTIWINWILVLALPFIVGGYFEWSIPAIMVWGVMVLYHAIETASQKISRDARYYSLMHDKEFIWHLKRNPSFDD